MNILYDHQAFTIQRYGGISRYFYHLITELRKMGDISSELSLRFSNNDYVAQMNSLAVKSFMGDKEFKGKYQLMRAINNYFTTQRLKKPRFDIFHPTYYDNYFLKPLQHRKPYVLTVYDLIHEKFAATYPQLNNEKDTLKNKKELLEKAERVMAISHSTKLDLIDVYGIDASKIDVVHLASSFSVSAGNVAHSKDNYILFVGNRSMYKNFCFFLEVAAHFLKQYGLKLVCAGSAPFNEEEKALINGLDIAGAVVHTKFRTDEELVALYKKAIFFVFPSLYEGFGIPILEALESGCPALVSNTSSFPEVGGDAVLYFDPSDPQSLHAALNTVINDAALRQQMMSRGIAQSQKFSWAKCAAETLSTYRAAI